MQDYRARGNYYYFFLILGTLFPKAEKLSKKLYESVDGSPTNALVWLTKLRTQPEGTATLKVSLFRRSPHAEIGAAWSQSPLCESPLVVR